MIAPAVAVGGLTALCVLLAWTYERRCTIERPPLGVFGLGDVLVLLSGVVIVPYVHISLPLGLVLALLGLGAISILAFLFWTGALRSSVIAAKTSRTLTNQ